MKCASIIIFFPPLSIQSKSVKRTSERGLNVNFFPPLSIQSKSVKLILISLCLLVGRSVGAGWETTKCHQELTFFTYAHLISYTHHSPTHLHLTHIKVPANFRSDLLLQILHIFTHQTSKSHLRSHARPIQIGSSLTNLSHLYAPDIKVSLTLT